MHKILSVLAVALIALPAFAQTPQQMEMLRRRMNNDSPVRSAGPDSATMEQLLSALPNDIPTDEEIEAIQMPKAEGWDELQNMTPEEKTAYAAQQAEGKIFLKTGSYKILTAPDGGRLCQIEVNLINNSDMTLKQLTAYLTWGETGTYIEFSNVEPKKFGQGTMGLGGTDCEKISQKPQIRLTACSLGNLTKEQCGERFVGL